MNETLADIVAGMRDPENDYITNNDLRELADRIEAAAKRAHDIAAALLAAKDVMSPHPDPEHAPGPRNCDVGTAEEQEAIYHATGNVYHTLTLQEVLSWAQMPYEEGGAA